MKTAMLAILAIIAILSIFAVLLYYVEDDILFRSSAIITIFSLGIAPTWYVWKKSQDEKTERIRASKNIYTELIDALAALDEKKYPANLTKIQIDGKWIHFMNRKLNHDFYDSLVFSGKINFLPPKIQQRVQDVFQIIKDRNFHIRTIRDLEDGAGKGEDITHKTKRYYAAVEKNELFLLEEIPKMKKILKEEFDI